METIPINLANQVALPERLDSTAPHKANGVPPVPYRGLALRAAKQFYQGTHRACSPQETLARVRPFFRQLGITRLANVTGLDRIPVSTVIAMRPNSRNLANGSGKGFDRLAATVSAAMETIEFYHAEEIRLPIVEASYAALACSQQMIPLSDLQLLKHSLFDPQRPERWVAGWDIVNQREVFVPYIAIDMAPHDRGRGRELTSFQMGSNGLASGNVLLEAIAAALFEAIERDAVTCHRVASQVSGEPLPRVRMETIAHPLVRDLVQRLEQVGIRPVLYDCTNDIEMPTYMGIIYDTKVRRSGIYKGYGCHLDPAIAMMRALTEAVQARAIYIAGSRDDVFDHRRFLMKQMDRAETLQILEKEASTVDAGNGVSEATSTFEGDLHLTIEKLKRAGMDQVIVVDLSHADIGVPVVKVFVPGLEGYMFPFYKPGRRALDFAGRGRSDFLHTDGVN